MGKASFSLLIGLLFLNITVIVAIINASWSMYSERTTIKGFKNYCFSVTANGTTIDISLIPPSIACFQKPFLNLYIGIKCTNNRLIGRIDLEQGINAVKAKINADLLRGTITISPSRYVLGMELNVTLTGKCKPLLRFKLGGANEVEVGRRLIRGIEEVNDTLILMCAPHYCLSLEPEPHVKIVVNGDKNVANVIYEMSKVSKTINVVFASRKDKEILYNPFLYVFIDMGRRIWLMR